MLENPDDYAVSFYHMEGSASVLSNFIIRNSYMGIFIVGNSPTIRNVTIVNNRYGIKVYDGSRPDISNSIFWNLSDDLLGYHARYSCIRKGNHIGEGNIDANPLFVDFYPGDYHLLSERGRYWPEHNVWVIDKVTSPCIDGGDPTANQSGEPMPNGGRINMGAYGGTGYASMSEMWWLDGDINHDGVVNMIDLSILAAHWLEESTPIPPEPQPKGRTCFVADTPVWVDGVLVQISNVVSGQMVGKAYCDPAMPRLEEIEKVEEHEGTFEYRDIVLESGNRISVVDAHCFMLDSGQWIAAQNLTSDLRLKTLNGTVGIKRVAIRAVPYVGKVHNLKIDGTDQYLVGEDGVIVRDY